MNFNSRWVHFFYKKTGQFICRLEITLNYGLERAWCIQASLYFSDSLLYPYYLAPSDGRGSTQSEESVKRQTSRRRRARTRWRSGTTRAPSPSSSAERNPRYGSWISLIGYGSVWSGWKQYNSFRVSSPLGKGWLPDDDDFFLHFIFHKYRHAWKSQPL